MTVPFLVREVSYSVEAILARIEFLERALDHGSMIVVSSSVWSLDGSTRIVLAERVRRLLNEIADMRGILAAVLETVWVGEGQRRGVVERGFDHVATCVMSGLAGCLESTFGRTAWPTVAPIAAALVDGIGAHDPIPRTVTVSPRSGYATTAPATVHDRVARIPGGSQRIRIERYPSASGNRFEVYLAGTNFAGDASDPWNVASNGELVATGWSPSLDAVRTAMRVAGVTRDTPVIITGHSQGGLIALAIAASGEFDVDGVITVGTPVGAVPTVTGVPALHLIHPEDPVPALGGRLTSPSTTWLIPTTNGETFIDAHHREAYLPSATALDDLNDPRVPNFATAPVSTSLGVAREYSATVSAASPKSDGG